jgi:hypothetical protein
MQCYHGNQYCKHERKKIQVESQSVGFQLVPIGFLPLESHWKSIGMRWNMTNVLMFKGRYKTGGTGQLYDGFPDCEWKMNTP